MQYIATYSFIREYRPQKSPSSEGPNKFTKVLIETYLGS